ncbi:MAG: HD domain-containing protein [Bacteroidota bacterium]
MNFSESLHPKYIFEQVRDSSRELSLESYVVGGYVRDLLLKRDSKDIDFVCVGSGIELAKNVNSKLTGKSKLSYFKNFGTASIRHKKYDFEFVGARRESYQRDSRKPIVEDGTLDDDQKRRDFTINALAVSLNDDDYGQLVDPFDGLKDLKKKIIRTPLDPDITFSDDPLRIMRAIRFAAQLKFDIEPDTFASLSKNAERLKIVSAERIIVELNKIVLTDKPSYGFQLLFHSGVLKVIFPEMTKLQGVKTKNGQSHKDNFYHTLKVLDNISVVTEDLYLRWAAILHDIAKPATQRFNQKVGWTFHGHEDKGARMVPGIFKRLKLPMDDRMKYVQKLVRLHLRPIALVKKDITDSAVRRLLYETGDDIEDLMKLCRADITSKNHDRVKRYLANFDVVERKMVDVEANDKVRNFQPPVSGEEIMSTFDIQPGRVIGIIKERIKEAILEGEIPNEKEAARKLMLVLGKQEGLVVKEENI